MVRSCPALPPRIPGSGLLLALSLLLVAAPGVIAQGPGPGEADRSGGWVDLGLGTGWGQVVCDICGAERRTGGEVRFGIGTFLRPSMGLGVETAGWATGRDPARQVIGSVHLVGRFYPGSAPIRVQAGIGSAHYRGIEAGDAPDLRMLALGVQLGVSGEARVGARTRLEPGVSASLGAFGSLRRGEQEVWNRAGHRLLRLQLVVSRGGSR